MIAKSAPAPAPATPQAPPARSDAGFAGDDPLFSVPIEAYRHFDIELSKISEKEIGKLKDIVEWAKAKCDEPTMGNVLSKIAQIESQLGSPEIGQKRYSKVWQWIRLTKHIEDLDSQRDAMRKRWQI